MSSESKHRPGPSGTYWINRLPACSYCDATEGLRQHHDGGGYIAPDYVCEDCFYGTDTGPSFDDLPLAQKAGAAQ